MKKTVVLTRLAALLALAVSSQSMAIGTSSLDVTFTATLRETTCDMKIEGGTGDGKANMIPIGGETLRWRILLAALAMQRPRLS